MIYVVAEVKYAQIQRQHQMKVSDQFHAPFILSKRILSARYFTGQQIWSGGGDLCSLVERVYQTCLATNSWRKLYNCTPAGEILDFSFFPVCCYLLPEQRMLLRKGFFFQLKKSRQRRTEEWVHMRGGGGKYRMERLIERELHF